MLKGNWEKNSKDLAYQIMSLQSHIFLALRERGSGYKNVAGICDRFLINSFWWALKSSAERQNYPWLDFPLSLDF